MARWSDGCELVSAAEPELELCLKFVWKDKVPRGPSSLSEIEAFTQKTQQKRTTGTWLRLG